MQQQSNQKLRSVPENGSGTGPVNICGQASANRLVRRIVGFGGYLRKHGIPADPGGVIDAQRIAALGYLGDHALLKSGYRSCFCRNPQHWQQFDALFDAYWQLEFSADVAAENPELSSSGAGVQSNQRLLGFAGTSEREQDAAATGAGDFKALSLADFRFVFDPVQMHQIERLVEVLAKRIRRQECRRKKISSHGGRIELGRSVQRSIRYQGTIIDFRFRQKVRRLPRFVLILDVSQSMDVYAKLFLRFTRVLMTLFESSEAFAFNTELIPLGRGFHQLMESDFERELNSASKGWLGGTKIALSLQSFNNNYLRSSVDHKTTVVIFSDGCDTATPEELATEVGVIQRRAKKLIWINPLLGRFAEGESDPNMDLVSPLVDAYRSAHNLASLKELQTDLLS